MIISRRKVEVVIDDCLSCPYIEINDPEKMDWKCTKLNIILRRDSLGWLSIPPNCPLEKVDDEHVIDQQPEAPTLEEPLQSGVDPV